MKKWVSLALVAAMSLSAAFAVAEESSSLKDFTGRLKEGTVKEEAAEPETAEPESEEEGSYGKPVKLDDPFFEKVRSSAYLTEDKYSRDANVMIEVKNVSGRTLYPRKASIVALNAAGEVVEEETYSSCGPEMVENGGSLFIWDRFYGMDTPLDEIASFAVTVETETSSYTDYQTLEAQGVVMDGIVYALVENKLDTDIYGIDAVAVIEDADGRLLDISEIGTGNAVGVFPGSTMILRANARDYANDTSLDEGSVTVYATHELD